MTRISALLEWYKHTELAINKTIKNMVNDPPLTNFPTKHGCLTEIYNLIQAQTVGFTSTVTAQNCVAWIG